MSMILSMILSMQGFLSTLHEDVLDPIMNGKAQTAEQWRDITDALQSLAGFAEEVAESKYIDEQENK